MSVIEDESQKKLLKIYTVQKTSISIISNQAAKLLEIEEGSTTSTLYVGVKQLRNGGHPNI